MAGMLPGVESARRRRFRQGGSANPCGGGSRRPAFCLYEPQPSSSSLQRSFFSKVFHGEELLGGAAREAKERLDERLRSQRSNEMKRNKSMGGGGGGGEPMMIGNVQREVFSKKSSKRFSWSKLSWMASEQVECAVCLDNFKSGDILVHLPCAHRFHWSCAMPWLEATPHCPCCRTPVSCQM